MDGDNPDGPLPLEAALRTFEFGSELWSGAQAWHVAWALDDFESTSFQLLSIPITSTSIYSHGQHSARALLPTR